MAAKLINSIGFGDTHGQKAYKFIVFGDIHGVEGKHVHELFGPSTVPDLKLSNICNSRFGPLLGN